MQILFLIVMLSLSGKTFAQEEKSLVNLGRVIWNGRPGTAHAPTHRNGRCESGWGWGPASRGGVRGLWGPGAGLQEEGELNKKFIFPMFAGEILGGILLMGLGASIESAAISMILAGLIVIGIISFCSFFSK
jgi:hypothetical protein